MAKKTFDVHLEVYSDPDTAGEFVIMPQKDIDAFRAKADKELKTAEELAASEDPDTRRDGIAKVAVDSFVRLGWNILKQRKGEIIRDFAAPVRRCRMS